MSLKPTGYRDRLIEKEILSLLHAFGGVCIDGPKWCGKTWTGLSMSNSCFMIADINEYGVPNIELAKNNIRSALDGDVPHLIDEWQDLPMIWDAVRSDIDKTQKNGRFILTGSSTPKKNKPLHSGTGRIRHVAMRPMSLYESNDSSGAVSLSDIMMNRQIASVDSNIEFEKIVEAVISGGWPRNITCPFEDRVVAVKGYVDSIIDDASVFDGKRRNKNNLWLVLRSLARNECTLANDKKICDDTGVPFDKKSIRMILTEKTEDAMPSVSYDTVKDYLDVFDNMFLLNDQPAFDPHIKSSIRVGKSVKRHLADPSIAVAIMGLGKDRLMNDLSTLGFLFESLCERDLDIYSRYLGGKLYHYRDATGCEIDAIIEMPDGKWGAFEIKLNASKVDEAVEHLKKFRNKMKKHANTEPSVLCVICGMSQSYLRDDGIYVVSIADLKP